MRITHGILAAVLLCPLFIVAQSESQSLGDLARQNKAAHKSDDSSKSKKVLDNEDLQSKHGPIPEISLTKTDNSQQIVEAILEFSKTHTPQETESEIHSWYNDEMNLFHGMVQRTAHINLDRMSPTSANSLERSREYESYEQYQQTRNARQQRDISDLRALADDNQVIQRINATLVSVRSELKLQKHWDFEWFVADPIRNTYIYMAPRAN